MVIITLSRSLSMSTTNLIHYFFWGKTGLVNHSCAFSLIEILEGLNPEPHLLHTCSLHTQLRHTLPAAISSRCWMPLILVPHLLRWETGDRSNLSQRYVLSPPFLLLPSLRLHPYSADPGICNKERRKRRRVGSRRWRRGGGGLVWVIVNSAPALLVAQEWPIISHWAKWHEFININNSSKIVFSGCCTEAPTGPY